MIRVMIDTLTYLPFAGGGAAALWVMRREAVSFWRRYIW